MEPLGVEAAVEREQPRVDPALSQGGQQVEQVLLRAADPCTLITCRTFTAA